MRGRRPRPRYSDVMATIAVFIALGGTGYAAITLPKNSVSSKQIRNGQVKNADLGKDAVTGVKVKAGSLESTDFKPGQLVAGAPGPAGPKGETGPAGATGAAGAAGAAGKNGTDGTPGTARAYAYVDNNALVPARTKGFTALTHTGTGTYCLTLDPLLGIDTTKVPAVASIAYNGSAGNRLFAFWFETWCPAGQVGVGTANEDGGTGTTFAFSDEDFSVIVP
jgi:hypothetical protein